jgi:hypothetical protein
MADHHGNLPVRPRVEQLESRETPSVTARTQNFDTTPRGQLPAGWAQWSSTGQSLFTVSGQFAVSQSQSLTSSSPLSGVAARAWDSIVQPADVEVSTALLLDSFTPGQVFLRGTNLNSARPNYYGLTLMRASNQTLDLRLHRVVGGVTATQRIVQSMTTFGGGWVRLTFRAQGSTLRGQLFRPDTGQYLDSAGRWQATPQWAITLTDTAIAGGGQVGVGRPGIYAGGLHFDDFRVLPPTGDTSAPTVSITAPAPVDIVTGTRQVQVTASDNVAVARIEFYVDGALRALDYLGPYQWAFDTTTTTNKTHLLTARAYDVAGNSASATIPVIALNFDALSVPTIPRHYSHIRIAELAYGANQLGTFEDQLLRNSVDLVVTQGGTATGHITSVAPTTPQLLYTNISTLYLDLLTDWLGFADRHGYSREGAFYHVKQATAYSGNSPSSLPVNWFWGVYREDGWMRAMTHEARGLQPQGVPFGRVGESVYIGYPEKFREINLDLSQVASASWDTVLEYATAVDAQGRPTGWKRLSRLGDDTNDLHRSGRVWFNPPRDWAKGVINTSPPLFYVRFRTTSAGTAPIARTILGRDYTAARGGNTGVIPAFDVNADIDRDGYLNDAEWARRAPGMNARFLYESRSVFGTYGQMRFATNPSDAGFRAWTVDSLRRFLKNQPAAIGLFMDNSQGTAPVYQTVVRESIANYTNDFARLLNEITRAVTPRVFVASSGNETVIRSTVAYYDEFAIRALAHTYEQFESVAARVTARSMLRTPSPYAILDSLPTNGSPTDPRTQMATLAYYYLIQDPNTTFLNFFGGFEPTTSWTRHWVQAVAYNVGRPLAAFREFATGRDPSNTDLHYRVYQRAYGNALVLYKPRSTSRGLAGGLGTSSATTHTLPGTYRRLNADGSLGTAITSISLRNGEGAILIKV